MIKVLYTMFGQENSNPLFEKLPKNIIEDASSFKRREDRLSKLYGKLLLMEGLQRANYDIELIKAIRHSSHNRPYINSMFDFNISHAGQCVICVISDAYRVGIDVEKKIPLDFGDFNNVWTHQEQDNILTSKAQEEQFYIYWTRKEAVMKADGRGMNLELNKINVTDNVVLIDRECWNLTELKIHAEYIAHLATDRPLKSNIVLEQLKFTAD